MGVVRNSINVIGITPETELPKEIRGQAILYSDSETIHIPDSEPGAKGIFQIMIQLDIQSDRVLTTSLGEIMTIDGVREYKIIYTAEGESDKASFLTLKLPFNTFIELPKVNSTLKRVEVFVADAYFDLLDKRNIYCYTLYLVDVEYEDYLRSEENKDRTKGKVTFKFPEFNQVKIRDDSSHIDEISVGHFLGYPQSNDDFKEKELNKQVDIESEYL